MDAAGNLTEISEFTNNRRLRLISYLDPDVAIGVSGTGLVVHRVSAGDPDETIFIANQAEYGLLRGDSCFLAWSSTPGLVISSMGEAREQATLCTPVTTPLLITEPPQFIVNFVNGCWMTLTDPEEQVALDCAGSGTNEGNPILLWDINGGDNQIWRATTIGLGLGT